MCGIKARKSKGKFYLERVSSYESKLPVDFEKSNVQ